MEEIEELRAKAIASMASSSAAANNQQKIIKSPPNKEEGELSSSDNDEIPTCSSTVNVAVTPPPVESNVTPVNRSIQSSRTGKLSTGYDPASPADIRPKTSVNQSHSKPFIRNSVPPKPGNQYSSAWYAPSLPFNNLVISFSDDDSESDSPEQRRDRISERKEVGAERSTSQMDPEYTTRTAKNQIKRMPKTVSLSRTRTFVSSLTKIHGANSRGSAPSLAEPITHNRNMDPLNTVSASQEHEVSSGINSKNSKLEDLRNQIAIRENQIKLKSVQQSKNTNLGSYDDQSGINQSQIAAKNSRPGDSARLVSNEPEKKRLKLDTSQRKSNPDAQQKVSGPSESKLRMPPPENIKQKNDGKLMMCRQFPNDVAVGKVDLTTHKQPAKVSQIRGTSGNLIPNTKDGESSKGFLDISSGCLQSGKSNMVMDLSVPLHQNSLLVQMASREEDRGASQFDISSPTKSRTDSQRISGTLGLLHSSDIDKPAQHNIERNSEYNEVTLGDRIQGSPRNTGLQDYSGKTNLSGLHRVNIQTLMEMEEAHDKELEEAQEHRHKCELEERNARKAYRESQRALFEANARCTYLYRKRELFSAQFRAYMMEDQSSFSPSVWNKHPKAGNDSFLPEADGDHMPTSGQPADFEFDIMNHEPNIQGTDSAVAHTSSQQLRGHTLVSEPPNEPDAITLGLLNVKSNNGVCSPSHHTHMSAEEDEEVSQSGHRITQSMIVEKNVENIENRVQVLNKKSERVSSLDNTKDYAVLEATLRSELFARFGTKNVPKNKNFHSEEDHIPNTCDENKNSDTIMSNKPCAVLEEEMTSNIGGTDQMDKSSCWSIQVYAPAPNLGDICSDYQSHRINDPDEGSFSLEKASTSIGTRSSLPAPIRKLVFSYVRATPLISFRRDQIRAQKKSTQDVLHEEDSLAHSELILSVVRTHVRGNMGEVGCYACNYSIDPLWPVCMFELRGKCNDEECVWQHMKNDSGVNIEQHDCSGGAGCVLGLSSDVKKFSSAHSIARHLQQCVISSPPMYLVGLDLLKADLRTSGTVLTQSIGMCWQKGFSTSSSVPFIIQRPLVRRDSRLGGQRSRNGPSMHFRSHDDSWNDVDDPEQCLDKALALFGDINKLEGMAKVQNMLSRAIETNPTSPALWIVYLHIHYRNATTIGKDDLFSHAIHNNEGSYELWLMYINSRAQLEDRIVAYNTAISALCRDASLPGRDRVHASACILDLYLHFVDYLRMSGQIEKAIQRIHGLLRLDSADNGLILGCLTVQDKCLFYMCCVYVLLYKKLPDPVVAQFEYKKELQFGIEWPSVYLPAIEERRALALMKMGVDSITSTEGPYEKEARYISISHAGAIAALEGIETSMIELNEYTQLYPTCLELVLVSARLNKIEGFEHILSNWPKEIPGIQCIWNQYVQYALESKGFDFAKQLMVRWFETGKMDIMEDDTDSDAGFTFSNPNDELFGLLNLSVHRLLQNDHVKARSAIDKALEVSDPEDFLHCAKEHAVFLSSEVLDRTGDGPCSGILGLLNIYIKDARALPLSDPLSRKFCQDIKKPRIRKLINNLLGQVSFNCSLFNSVLESWYGPSLLPENFEDLKDLVDLVETLIELFPANYSLAFAVCKLITARKITSASVLFWASSVLVNSFFQAVPVAPESKWVEAADILSNFVEAAQGVSERFYQHGLSIYPFSVKLWKSYYNFGKKTGNGNSVVQSARDRGMKIE
ncbi:hypothetical protein ACHQM5_021454 [Ranunculus cassubicifolius]